jgi:hypothetical protein
MDIGKQHGLGHEHGHGHGHGYTYAWTWTWTGKHKCKDGVLNRDWYEIFRLFFKNIVLYQGPSMFMMHNKKFHWPWSFVHPLFSPSDSPTQKLRPSEFNPWMFRPGDIFKIQTITNIWSVPSCGAKTPPKANLWLPRGGPGHDIATVCLYRTFVGWSVTRLEHLAVCH